MIFDPFVTQPHSIEMPVSFPELNTSGFAVTSLFPNFAPPTGTKTTPDLQDYVDALSKTQVQNRPAYGYTDKERNRYSNPFLQYDPELIGGTDIEDVYGKYQGSGEQFLNALVKTGATAAGSFIDAFTSLPGSIDAIRQGKPFDEDSTIGRIHEWQQNLEDKFPNYYTQWERDHPYASAVPFSGGFSNFWGDQVLKNAGYTIGSLAASALVDAGIELATGGSGTPATMILATKQISNAIKPLKNMFRNLSKVSVVNKVDDIGGVMRVGNNMSDSLSTLAKAYDIKKGAQFAGVTYFSAQGEAMIEGYQNYLDVKTELLQKAVSDGLPFTADLYTKIENDAQNAGRTTTLINMPLIAVSNVLQFSNILKGKDVLKTMSSPYIDVVQKNGISLVNNYSRKKGWMNFAKELGKDFATEGFEEGSQYYVGSSLHDYYVDNFNKEGQKSLLKILGDNLPNTLKDEELYKSMFVGSLTGGLMGAYRPTREHLIGAKDRADRMIQTIKPVYDRFNSTLKDLVHTAENVEFSTKGQEFEQFHAAHKSLFSAVHSSLKMDTYDSFESNLRDLQGLELAEFNRTFGTELETEQQKVEKLASIISEAQAIKQDVVNTAKTYSKNPFEGNFAIARIKEIFRVNEPKVKQIQAKMFEDFKELSAYNVARLRNTNRRMFGIRGDLYSQGYDDTILGTLTTISQPEAVEVYKQQKQIQLDALKAEIEYNEQLQQQLPRRDFKKDLEIKITKQRIADIEALFKTLDAGAAKLRTNKKDVKTQESLTEAIIKEELGAKASASIAKHKKMLLELRRQQSIATNTAAEIEQQVNEPQAFAAQQLQTAAQNAPRGNVIPPSDKLVKFNREFGKLFEGDDFTIKTSLDSEEDIIHTYHTKEGGVVRTSSGGNTYQFSPDGTVKEFDQTGTLIATGTFDENFTVNLFEDEDTDEETEEELEGEEVNTSKKPKPPKPSSPSGGPLTVRQMHPRKAEPEEVKPEVVVPTGQGIGMIDPAIPMYYNYSQFETGNDLSKDPMLNYLKNMGVNVDWLKGKVLTRKSDGRFLFVMDNRLVMFVKVGKGVIPFYFSSQGTSGKEITWHPIFGIDTDKGWFIKGSVDENKQMKLGKRFAPLKTAQDILSQTLQEFRSNVKLNEDQRDNLIDLRGAEHRKLNPNAYWYQRDDLKQSEIFVNFNVVDKMGPDGAQTNENYTKVVAYALYQIDATVTPNAEAPAPPAEPVTEEVKPKPKKPSGGAESDPATDDDLGVPRQPSLFDSLLEEIPDEVKPKLEDELINLKKKSKKIPTEFRVPGMYISHEDDPYVYEYMGDGKFRLHAIQIVNGKITTKETNIQYDIQDVPNTLYIYGRQPKAEKKKLEKKKEEDFDLLKSLSEDAEQEGALGIMNQAEQEEQLNEFFKNTEASDQLKSIIKWRLGKGISFKCK